ncbi:hypothetical protein BgiBS90_027777 [Biomphalaria glabrata]|nr:hypothetical protein BgiBS90_027777 [Biomphalaria glabrata]
MKRKSLLKEDGFRKTKKMKKKSKKTTNTNHVTDKKSGLSLISTLGLFGSHETQVSVHGEVDLHKHVKDCQKNPGHKKFIPVESFHLNSLPRCFRDSLLYQLIKVTCDLAVRVEVKWTSPRRVEFWPESQQPYPFYNSQTTSASRFGSGALINVIKRQNGIGTDIYGQIYDLETRRCPCQKCQESDNPSRIWWEFIIFTATHVVFDEYEAEHTVCRLFYDSNSSKGFILDQASMYRSSIGEDTCDLSFVFCDKQDLGIKMFQMMTTWSNLWQKVEEKFHRSRFAFIVSHPHGCAKQVSFGQWVKSYEWESYNRDLDLTKLTYTTSTCPGSSGAAVYCVGFNEIVHSGMLNSKLNVSGIGFSYLKSRDFSLSRRIRT